MNPETLSKSSAQSQTFGARPVYILALAGLTVLGVLGSAYVSAHERHVGIVMWALTGLYLLALATVVSLRIGVGADGLTQRWLFSHSSAAWRDVARLERTARRYALRDAKGRDIVMLHLLPPAAQQSVADAAIDRARLRPGKAPPQAPILEHWERKK